LLHATKLLLAHDTIADTLARARHYARRAIDALAIFPAGQARSALVEAAEFAVARAY
jgi:octaprenyl-diphosphate synthase